MIAQARRVSGGSGPGLSPPATASSTPDHVVLGEPRGLFGCQRHRRGSGSDGNSGMLSRDQGGGGDHDARSEKRWTWGGGSEK